MCQHPQCVIAPSVSRCWRLTGSRSTHLHSFERHAGQVYCLLRATTARKSESLTNSLELASRWDRQAKELTFLLLSPPPEPGSQEKRLGDAYPRRFPESASAGAEPYARPNMVEGFTP